jgi:hypothetical protein
MELSMSKTDAVSPLRQRMIEDMAARKLNPHTHRFAAWLKRSPDTATADEMRCFQARPTQENVGFPGVSGRNP